MALPTYYESDWPVVTVVLAPSGFDDADLEKHIDKLLGYFHRGPFAILVDARITKPMATAHRKRLAEALSSAPHAERLRCTAVVISSIIQKNVLTAILWLFRPKSPIKSFTSIVDARSWIQATLASAAPTPRLERTGDTGD